jgi:hypothetical protein
MLRRTTSFVLFSSALLVLAGCGESHGSDDVGVSPRSDGGTTTRDDGGYVAPDTGFHPLVPDGGFRDAGVHPAADVGPPGDGAGDTWTGYIEAFSFPSGSDAVRIVLDAQVGSAPRTGTVYFGVGAPPPPATDPNLGYPPGYGARGGPVEGGGPGGYIAEGFGYRFEGATVSASRVQIDVDLGSLWAEWCSLQYPIDLGGGAYGCLPNTGFSSGDQGCSYPDPVTREDIAIDCGRLALCDGFGTACRCTATECAAASGGRVTFDFHVTGSDGTGTIGIGAPHNVYLTR